MQSIKLSHDFPCSSQVFWERLFFDADFNRRLYLEDLGFLRWEITKSEDATPRLTRTIEVVPALGEVPAALKPLLGDGLGYREIGRFDRNSGRYDFEVIPNKLSDRITVTGQISCSELGPTLCRRLFEFRVEARIFGVSGLLERRILDDLVKSLEQGAKAITRYLKESGLEGIA